MSGNLGQSHSIFYAAIARDRVILVSQQCEDGDFDAMLMSLMMQINASYNTKASYSSHGYCFHVLVEDGLTYVCTTDSSSGKGLPFSFLKEVKAKFVSGSLAFRAAHADQHELDRDFSHVLEELMDSFNRGDTRDGLSKLRSQVNDVKVVMAQNIEKVLDRGEKLETLVDKTSDLEANALHFRSSSRRVRRKMFCKNVKMWIVILVVVAIIITFIILFATNVIPVH